VQEQGDSGNFCSPESASGSCPSDVPRGDGIHGKRGVGSCQAISSTGVCTYEAQDGQLTSIAARFLPVPEMQVRANPTHHGDPASGFESGEQAVQVQGVSSGFSSPECASGSYPSGVPGGMTVKPTCALRSPTGDADCALICTPSAWRASGANGECGKGSCQEISVAGLCTYEAQDGQLATIAAKILPAPEVQVLANPAHYGDQASGGEVGEQDMQVQGDSGGLCSPDGVSGSRPYDVLSANGVDGECGTGSCQASLGMSSGTYEARDGQLASIAAMVRPAPEVQVLANPTSDDSD